MRSTNQADWRETVLWGTYPASHPAQWTQEPLCLPPPLPPTPTCTLYMALNLQTVASSQQPQLCAPRSPRRHSITHIMKRVNETWLQSNYSSAITECGSQNQDWAEVQLRVESVSHRSANLLPDALIWAHKEAHSEHCQPTGSMDL